MNDVREFIRAASPWIAMGLLVAILVIRGAASTKNAKDGTAESYGMDGMSLGMCFAMDSLKSIQKTFRIFLRLTHAAKILCIVGAVLSGVGALCLITSYYGGHVFDLFGKPVMIFHPDTNWKQQGVELLAASIRMIANCILLAFAQDYLKTEQSDGTPFTIAGAEKLKNLGIRCIWIPIVAIVVAVTVAVWLGEERIGEVGNAFSITTGIALILASIVFRYGAELERQLHRKTEN